MAFEPAGSQYEAQLASLKAEAEPLEQRLSGSRTAYAPGTDPTIGDLSAQSKLMGLTKNIEILEGKKLAERWYGKKREEETFKGGGTVESPFMRALNALSTPLYGVTGAVESLTGTGSKRGLFENINENVKQREGFGNILRRTGLPHAASMPLGFALDVAFDPVNWATFGTAALVPRIAAGLLKGGPRAAAAGAVSRLAPLGLKTANVLTAGGVTRALKPLEGGAQVGKFSGLARGVAENIRTAGAEATERYDKLTGRTMVEAGKGGTIGKNLLSEQPGYTSPYKFSVGDAAETFLRTYVKNGDEIVDFFKYSPADWWEKQKMVNQLLRIGDKAEQELGYSFFPLSQKQKDAIRAIPDGKTTPLSLTSGKAGTVKEGQEIFGAGEEIADNLSDARIYDGANRLAALAEEAGVSAKADDFIRLRQGMTGETGFKAYDNLVKKMYDKVEKNDPMKIKNIIDAYKSYIQMFKIAKIGLTPSAWTNAILGNAVMLQMAGISIANPGLLKMMSTVSRSVFGGDKKQRKVIASILNEPHWAEYAKTDPRAFVQTFGFDLDEILRQTKAEISFLKGPQQTVKLGKEATAAELRALEETADKIGDLIKHEPRSASERSMSFADQEMREPDTWLSKKQSDLRKAKLAGTATTAQKVAHLALNESTAAYGKLDQGNRLAAALHLTSNGVTEGELKVMSRTFGMEQKDIMDVGTNAFGQKIFKLTPEKATSVAMETFLNYTAMPGAVKMLRTLPILGAPFASFMYGIGTRTGKTALYNPAIFNKTNFLFQEFSGDKSPLEKEALDSKYYSWFNSPGMVKMPFNQQNPLYMNLTNLLPYYSLNLVTPTERKYGKGIPDTVMSFLDKVPLLQDPAGQVLFDYFIQPMLLSDGEVPQGSFGQALYPSDATTLQKFGYAGRQLAEAVTPGLVAPTALITPDLGKYTEAIPSYRWRQLAYAMRGKSTIGVPTKEAPGSKVLRTMLSGAGIPTHPMNLTYVAQDVKKKIKQNK